jgi:hypothetical protein
LVAEAYVQEKSAPNDPLRTSPLIGMM